MPGKRSTGEKAGSQPLDHDLQQPSLSEADSMPPLTAGQIEEIGVAAATALNSPIWKQAYKMALNQIFARWLQSDASEASLRESLWHQAQNLFLLEDMMQGPINDLQALNLSKAEQAEEDLNRYEDMQGFGLEDILDGMDTIETH